MMPSPDHRLMNALGFTPLDLDANRNGFMSKEQRRRLREEQRSNIGNYVLGAAALMFGAVLAFMASLSSIQRHTATAIGDALGALILCVGFAGGAVVVIWLLLTKWRRIEADLDRGTVCGASGHISLDVLPSEAQVNCTLKLAGHTFEICKAAMLALRDGEPYHVYFLPNTNRILSIELFEMSTEKAKRAG